MSNSTHALQYENEDDRCYGLAGMTLSILKRGGMDRVAYMDIDAQGPMVSFANSYYFCGNPALSAKAAWKNVVDNYCLTLGMVIANVLARKILRDREELDRRWLDPIYDEALAEGTQTCSLEEDEVRYIFDSSVRDFHRIFSNSMLAPRLHDLARIIARKRRFSGLEMREELYYLGLD